jgi:ABC-type nitrate/sulfonate/bicarbonate transport system ATPase subunit
MVNMMQTYELYQWKTMFINIYMAVAKGIIHLMQNDGVLRLLHCIVQFSIFTSRPMGRSVEIYIVAKAYLLI